VEVGIEAKLPVTILAHKVPPYATWISCRVDVEASGGKSWKRPKHR